MAKEDKAKQHPIPTGKLFLLLCFLFCMYVRGWGDLLRIPELQTILSQPPPQEDDQQVTTMELFF